MSADRTDLARVVDGVDRGVDELRALIARLPDAVDTALSATPVPAPVRETIVRSTERVVDLATRLLDPVVELLRGAAAPLLFFDAADRWQAVRGTATGVVGALDPALLPATGHWSGPAADAYTRAATPQSAAAARIGAVADKVSLTLLTAATAGVAFYVAVGFVLARIIAATVAAVAATSTVAGTPFGLAMLLREVTVSPALLAGAVTALIGVLGAQAAQLVVLHGEAADATTFPGGAWPSATADRHTDATVTDGDADWSLGP